LHQNRRICKRFFAEIKNVFTVPLNPVTPEFTATARKTAYFYRNIMSELPENHPDGLPAAAAAGKPQAVPELAVVALVILVALLAVYLPGCGGDFIRNWDDNKYLVDNAAAHGFSLANIKAAFSQSFVGNYAPLHIISYMVDYTLWGVNPFWSRLVNVLLHGVNGVLFYYLLRRMSWLALPALLAALFFVLHPVQVESVAWISQRKSVLAMVFTLATMVLYRRAGEGKQGAVRNYLPALALFVLALLAKSAVVFLPAALLVFELTQGKKRPWPELVRIITPFALLALLFCVVTVTTQHEARAGWHGGSPLATFYTMAVVAIRYLRMILLPTQLSALYDPVIYHSLLEPVVAGSLLLLAALAAAMVRWGKRYPAQLFWALFSLLALLPVSQVVPLTTLMNDRYLYFPLLGVVALVVGSLTPLLTTATLRGRGVLGLAVALLLLLAFLSERRVLVWKDDLTLWSDAVQKAPGSQFARQGLAEALEARGDLAGAIGHYLVALQIDPGSPELNSQAGVVLAQQGDFRRALPLLRTAQRLKPDNSAYRNNLAGALLESGSYREAIGELKALESASAPSTRSSCMLGALYEKTGDAASATLYFNKAAALDAARAGEECSAVRNLLGLH
jgi:Flp pilus assembly protein TadD